MALVSPSPFLHPHHTLFERRRSADLAQNSSFSPDLLHSSRSAPRLTIHGFHPLPPIIASPICTPSISTDIVEFGSTSSGERSAELSTPPTTPVLTQAMDALGFQQDVPPKWVSTPPTPPKSNPLFHPDDARPKPSGFGPPQNADSSMTERLTTPPSMPAIQPKPRKNFFLPNDPIDGISEPLSPLFNVYGSWGAESEDGSQARLVERRKDNLRRCHALIEILETELSYVMDLKALVDVFLPKLVTLSFRSTSRSSSLSSSRAGSLSALQMSPINPSRHADSMTNQKEKAPPQTILAPHEIETLFRNARDLLEFHSHFVTELQSLAEPLSRKLDGEGGGVEGSSYLQKLEDAIRSVSDIFMSEASHFSAYERFCAGHSQALEIVHRVQEQFPSEWDALEHECTALIFAMLNPDATATDVSIQDSGMQSLRRKRASSASSADEKSPPAKSTNFSMTDLRHSRRLAFLDYLIKPVQRICKYPLLLDQLKTGKSIQDVPPGHDSPTATNAMVENAALDMRRVISLVDDARHRQEVTMQSSLIASRISLALPVVSSLAMCSSRAIESLTPSFLSSLGICLLAGSLDVLHNPADHPPGNATTAKYLGAFLYMGGYMILVKVTKARVYEPRHWFRLADLELTDVADSDSMLPFSFRLSCKEHDFDFGAACQKEKVAWLTSIRESLVHCGVAWINEPTPSLQSHPGSEYVASTLDGPFEVINAGLPTIPSASETLGLPVPDAVQTPTADAVSVTTTNSPTEFGSSAGKEEVVLSAAPSRHSSTTSVKALFSHSSDPATILVRRPGPASRSTVNLGLQDVLSAPCITARTYAASREEELFKAPLLSKGSSSVRLTKGGRLLRQESVRVPRRRPTTTYSDAPPSPARSLTFRGKPSSHTRRRSNQLSVSEADLQTLFHPQTLDDVQAESTVSGRSTTGAAVYFPSWTSEFGGLEQRGMRQSTLFVGVKDFFSSTSSLERTRPGVEETHGTTVNDNTLEKKTSSSFLRRWGTRWRTQSAPSGPPG